jgi:hypothetical protein
VKVNIPLDEMTHLCLRLQKLTSQYAHVEIERDMASKGTAQISLVVSPHNETAARMRIIIESDYGVYLSFGSNTDIEVPFPTGYETRLPWDEEVSALCEAVVACGMLEQVAFQNDKAIGGRFKIKLRNGDVIQGGWAWRVPLALRFGKRVETIRYSSYDQSVTTQLNF